MFEPYGEPNGVIWGDMGIGVNKGFRVYRGCRPITIGLCRDIYFRKLGQNVDCLGYVRKIVCMEGVRWRM